MCISFLLHYFQSLETQKQNEYYLGITINTTNCQNIAAKLTDSLVTFVVRKKKTTNGPYTVLHGIHSTGSTLGRTIGHWLSWEYFLIRCLVTFPQTLQIKIRVNKKYSVIGINAFKSSIN